MRLLRLLVYAFPILALIGVGAWFVLTAPTPAPTQADGSAPVGARLVVVASFDQMRGDYLQRWAVSFGEEGFERMKKEGVWYANAHLPYACSSTGPGHACISTGVPPSIHGIIENAWFNRQTGEMQNCVSGNRPYDRVPPDPSSLADDRSKSTIGFAPDQMLVGTVGDELRKQSKNAGRVYSLALKDRAAVLMGGKEPNGCYCFDTANGQFHTSAYYKERVDPWVEQFNKDKVADRWFNIDWTRLVGEQHYLATAGPDEVPAEGGSGLLKGFTFPHSLNSRSAKPDCRYYASLESSPFANELLWELAKRGIEAEQLGRKEGADLLFLGFSANDVVGHAFGPDSQEVMDMTLRSDKLVGEMLKYLREQVGDGHFTLIVTADHGVCPLPELADKQHPEAARFHPSEFAALGEAMDEAFGRRTTKPGQWVERIEFPWVYLNQRLAQEQGVAMERLEAFAAQWLGNRDISLTAFPRSALASPPASDPLLRSAQLSFQPERSGDVLIVTKPYTLPLGVGSKGTSHGSPHEYDTHVPILAIGAGIPALGTKSEPVSSLLVAPIVCRALGMTPPLQLTVKLPAW